MSTRTSTIDYATQAKFMYLFERVTEPIYFGPRGQGEGRVLYNVPLDDLPPNVARSVIELRKAIPPGTVNVIDVKYPPVTYDLGYAKRIPKEAVFSLFAPLHQLAAQTLIQIFKDQTTVTGFFSVACQCRDILNSGLWVYSVSSTILARKDMAGFKLPGVHEILPERFLNAAILREARRQARLLERDRSIIAVDQNFTGLDLNPENKVAYFRQDLGINAHHWHWHLIFTLDSPPGTRDRKGELFFYMHHAMIARFDAERLSNGLNRIVPLDIQQFGEEGYFPKLDLENAGIKWGSRQPNTTFKSVNRLADPNSSLKTDLQDLKLWNDRILEAIDSSIVVASTGQTIPLGNEHGIDVLGDLVEASILNPNRQFYGSLHNEGHNIIALCHDPDFRYKENAGVMFDTATAVRDPLFFRWHKYIDSLFLKHKRTLTPYEPDVLLWPGIVVTKVSVQTADRSPNTLTTFWEQRDTDLSRGLDFGRTTFNNLGAIWVRYTYLQHEPFSYHIEVNNTSRAPAQGTVRIFLAPRADEHRARLRYIEQRDLFFEMDKFTVALRPGTNVIERRSEESAVTIPWEQTFREIERTQRTLTPGQAVCGCGWPEHMLIPKGKADGQAFDLFVMITNWEQDRVRRRNPVSEAEKQGCRDSASFCGILDELYPDSKPMGFPFDRLPKVNGANQLPETIDDFVVPDSNMKTVQVEIRHRNTTVVAEGAAAPPNLPIISQTQSVGGYSRESQKYRTGGDVIGARNADEHAHSPMDYRSQQGSPTDWIDLGSPGQIYRGPPGPGGPPRGNPIGPVHPIPPRL